VLDTYLLDGKMKDMIEKENTVRHILDVSQQLLQTRGYNAFSYADISEAVGIRKASIHYHFPSKSDLGKALVTRYREAFRQERSRIDRDTDNALHKLEQFADLYLEGLKDGRVCLCGMLAADFTTLPGDMREEVKAFLGENEAWLKKVLLEGKNAGIIQYQGAGAVEAQLILTGLQGAQLIARSYGDAARFQSIARRLLAGLAT
jgi:TetR/AcrR family transcriptional regulator, transcriptional repressor for nem operon